MEEVGQDHIEPAIYITPYLNPGKKRKADIQTYTQAKEVMTGRHSAHV